VCDDDDDDDDDDHGRARGPGGPEVHRLKQRTGLISRPNATFENVSSRRSLSVAVMVAS
jgi:hypothetical protein